MTIIRLVHYFFEKPADIFQNCTGRTHGPYLVHVRVLAGVGKDVKLGVDIIEKVDNLDGSLC